MKNVPTRAPVGMLQGVVLGPLSMVPVLVVWHRLQWPLERRYFPQLIGSALAQTPLRMVTSLFHSRCTTRTYFALMQGNRPLTAAAPFDPRDETKHFLTIGDTGAGKNQFIKPRLYYAQSSGDTCVVLDPELEFIPEFYKPSRGDKILSPNDARGIYWYIADEVTDEADAVSVTRALKSSHPDNPLAQFFEDQACNIAAYLLTYSEPRYLAAHARFLSRRMQIEGSRLRALPSRESSRLPRLPRSRLCSPSLVIFSAPVSLRFVLSASREGWASPLGLTLATPDLAGQATVAGRNPTLHCRKGKTRMNIGRGEAHSLGAIPKNGWTDQEDHLAGEWSRRHRVFGNVEITSQAVQTVATQHRVPPVRQYLLRSQVGRRFSSQMVARHLSGRSGERLFRCRGNSLVLSTVTRTYQPSANCCLILAGPQGAKKSTALRTLAGEYFTDELADLGSKDAALQICGVWIVEISEFDSLARSESASIIAFMSRAADRFRPPFGKRVVECPRQCVFAGTVNHTACLREETGARRFWPVRCGLIDVQGLAHDSDQLWAEAKTRFSSGELVVHCFHFRALRQNAPTNHKRSGHRETRIASAAAYGLSIGRNTVNRLENAYGGAGGGLSSDRFRGCSRLVLRLFHEQNVQNKRCSTCSTLSFHTRVNQSRVVRGRLISSRSRNFPCRAKRHRTRGTRGTKPTVYNLQFVLRYRRT